MKLCVKHYSKEWSFPATKELFIHNRHSFHYAFICLSALLKELLYLHEVYTVICALKKYSSYKEISVDDFNPILSESRASSLHKI